MDTIVYLWIGLNSMFSPSVSFQTRWLTKIKFDKISQNLCPYRKETFFFKFWKFNRSRHKKNQVTTRTFQVSKAKERALSLLFFKTVSKFQIRSFEIKSEKCTSIKIKPEIMTWSWLLLDGPVEVEPVRCCGECGIEKKVIY